MTQMTEEKLIRQVATEIPTNCIPCSIQKNIKLSSCKTFPCDLQLGIAKRIWALVKQADYVQLDEDQSLPSGVKFGGNAISDAYNGGYLEAQQDMFNSGFRRIRRENETLRLS